MLTVAEKDPNDIDFRHIIWCSLAGTNDGSTSDDGDLQGATISSAVWSVVSGDVVIDTSHTNAISIAGVSYAANTVATAKLSGGTDGTQAVLNCRITTSDGRTLDQAIVLGVRESHS